MPAQARAENETVLRLSNITRRFGDLLANDGISLELRRGEIVALLGENGAGKTTLMNILFGHYVADSGSIEVFGKALPPGDPHAALAAGIGMVHQHFTLADQLTVAENIALGTGRLFAPSLRLNEARARIADLSRRFGLFVDPQARVGDLSVGERQRVEILKALYRDVRILILDEPTAVLTPAESEALFKTLKMLVAQGLSIIFISHKLNEVLAVSDRISVLRQGRLVADLATDGASRQQVAALMVGDEVEQPTARPGEAGEVILSLRAIHATPKHGVALGGIDLDLRAGEITGLAGVSGNGQSALASVIEGTLSPSAGEIRIAGKQVSDWSAAQAIESHVGRIPEDRHSTGMIADMSVTENVISEAYRSGRFSRNGLMDWNAARDFALGIIRDYDVKCPSPEARVRLLSGGNMQKLILGRVLEGNPRIILASQPTRGLDVGAVAYVHRRLIEARDRGAAILLISEDLDEIRALSDRILVISRGRLSKPSARGARSVRELGELMAGHGFAEQPHAA
jgi:general nucleoside transport system ATP-binding protein